MASPGLQKYGYSSLNPDKREIRLLILHQAESSQHAMLSGELITRSLDASPDYDALSYVWGKPEPALDIIISGSTFSVGPNLHKALVDMRYQYYEDSRNSTSGSVWWRPQISSQCPLCLWIDAICINQQDAAEREHQVSMMRDIYSKAQQVRAWLDMIVPDPHHRAFADLQRLMHIPDRSEGRPHVLIIVLDVASVIARYMFYRSTRIRRDLRTTQNRPKDSSMVFGAVDQEFWRPIVRIFDNEYWGRLWIQQEILLARKVLFHCGGSIVVSEKGLFRFQDAVYRHNNSVEYGDLSQGTFIPIQVPGFFTTILQGRQHVQRIRHHPVMKQNHNLWDTTRDGVEGPHFFFEMFLNTSNLKVTDPRDRVYGCLGLLSETQQSLVKVDYSLGQIQTYAQVYRSYIRMSLNLDFLCSRIDLDLIKPGMQIDIPTWMPAPEKASYFDSETIQAYQCSPLSLHETHFKAQISEDGKTLAVRAFRVDTIRCIATERFIYSSPILQWKNEVSEMYLQTANPSTHQHADVELSGLRDDPSFLELFRRGDNMQSYWRLWGQPPPSSEDLSHVLKHIVQAPQQRNNDSLSLAELVEEGSQEAHDSGRDDIIHGMAEAVKRSSFFVARDARQIGLVSNSSNLYQPEKGDGIYIVLGCSKPLVLRACEGGQYGRLGQFVLIGSVVLPVMMNGSFATRFIQNELGKGQVLEDIVQDLELT